MFHKKIICPGYTAESSIFCHIPQSFVTGFDRNISPFLCFACRINRLLRNPSMCFVYSLSQQRGVSCHHGSDRPNCSCLTGLPGHRSISDYIIPKELVHVIGIAFLISSVRPDKIGRILCEFSIINISDHNIKIRVVCMMKIIYQTGL